MNCIACGAELTGDIVCCDKGNCCNACCKCETGECFQDCSCNAEKE